MAGDGWDLVIFDCDGVLVDSERLSGDVLLSELAAFGIDIDFEQFATRFVGRSFPKVAQEIRKEFGVALPEGFEASYRARLLATFGRRLRMTPGLSAALDALAVRTCVATSSTPERAARSLEICGLSERFRDSVFTASEVTLGKPAPDLFLYAAGRMGSPPPRCLVIEDSLPGLAAARAAGMAAWRYTGGAQFIRVPALAYTTPAGMPAYADWSALVADLPRQMRRPATAAP